MPRGMPSCCRLRHAAALGLVQPSARLDRLSRADAADTLFIEACASLARARGLLALRGRSRPAAVADASGSGGHLGVEALLLETTVLDAEQRRCMRAVSGGGAAAHGFALIDGRAGSGRSEVGRPHFSSRHPPLRACKAPAPVPALARRPPGTHLGAPPVGSQTW